MIFEITHICGSPIKSRLKNQPASISDTIYFDPKTNHWYAGDDDGETTVKINFCPFCGVELSTLINPKGGNTK